LGGQNVQNKELHLFEKSNLPRDVVIFLSNVEIYHSVY